MESERESVRAVHSLVTVRSNTCRMTSGCPRLLGSRPSQVYGGDKTAMDLDPSMMIARGGVLGVVWRCEDGEDGWDMKTAN